MNRIRDGLWVTDIGSVRTDPLPESIDRVVSVCQDTADDNVSVPTEHYCMADGPDDGHVRGDHTYAMFEDAADGILGAIRDGETVLVHCHMGQSRSPAVCMAVYATIEGVGYWDAYDAVREVRGNIHPNRLLVGHVREYIGEDEPYTRDRS